MKTFFVKFIILPEVNFQFLLLLNYHVVLEYKVIASSILFSVLTMKIWNIEMILL